jgi:hypothetical protein
MGVPTNASVTGFISTTIDRVSKKFESYCGLPIREQSFIGRYDGNSCNELFTNNYPIVSVTSIKYRNSPLDSFSNTLAVSACSVYTFKVISNSGYFPFGNQTVEIVYNAGYSTIPQDIEQCAVEATAIVVKESNVGASDNKNISEARLGKSDRNVGGSTDTFIDISPKHKEILDNYRKPNIYIQI